MIEKETLVRLAGLGPDPAEGFESLFTIYLGSVYHLKPFRVKS